MRNLSALHVILGLMTLTAFGVNVSRYWFLGDDGYIAFRFSENIVLGHGPVYNPGERVEGYTQPVWVVLVALGMRLGFDPERFGPAVGILFGGLTLVLLLRLSRWNDARSGLWIWLAPAALALNRTHTGWCTGGLGTQLFAFTVLWSCVAFVREWRAKETTPWRSGLLFAVATLVRPEGGIFFAVAGLFFAVDVLMRRRRTLVDLCVWALPVVLLVGAHFLWRRSYYGFWLPNTFYAKVSGFWWDQASKYLGWFVRDHVLFVALPILLVLLRRGMTHVVGFFLATLVVWGTYLVYVGGDRFEYRFMTPVLPMLYWLLQESARTLCHDLAETASTRRFVRPAAAVLVALVLTTATLPTIVAPPVEPRDHIAPIEAIEGYARGRAQQGKFLRSLVEEGYLTGHELTAVRGAGALPYYSKLPILDLHGLNDVTIAHMPIEERGMVAHEKEPTLEYVKSRGVVMCNVHNTLVFAEIPHHLLLPGVEHRPYFPGPVRVVEAKGRFLAFGTTLAEDEFRRTFAKFRIHR